MTILFWCNKKSYRNFRHDQPTNQPTEIPYINTSTGLAQARPNKPLTTLSICQMYHLIGSLDIPLGPTGLGLCPCKPPPHQIVYLACILPNHDLYITYLLVYYNYIRFQQEFLAQLSAKVDLDNPEDSEIGEVFVEMVSYIV